MRTKYFYNKLSGNTPKTIYRHNGSSFSFDCFSVNDMRWRLSMFSGPDNTQGSRFVSITRDKARKMHPAAFK